MKAYPFMFAKSEKISEWHPVVLPGFILDREARNLLLEVAQNAHSTAPGEAIRATRQHSKLGTFDIIFQKRASGLTDMHHRRVDFREGFILRHRDSTVEILQSHLDAAHDAMMPTFERFQSAGNWSSAQSSSALELDLTKVVETTPLKKLRELPQAVERQATNAGATFAGKRFTPSGWMTPQKGVIIASVVATVTAGAFLIAAHRRRTSERASETARSHP